MDGLTRQISLNRVPNGPRFGGFNVVVYAIDGWEKRVAKWTLAADLPRSGSVRRRSHKLTANLTKMRDESRRVRRVDETALK